MNRMDVTSQTLLDAYLASRSDSDRNALFEHHWPSVQSLTAKILSAKRCTPMLDEVLSLLAERFLVYTIPGFDVDRNCRFDAYLTYSTLQGIKMALRSLSGRSARQESLQRAAERAEASLSHVLGRRPTDAELAEAMLLPESHIIAICNPVETITGREVAVTHEFDDIIDSMTSGLPRTTQRVVALYYWAGCTESEIAEILGTTQGRISTRLTQARRHILSKYPERVMIKTGLSLQLHL